jgi:uncharacterized protein YydD (DUF2326 family)
MGYTRKIGEAYMRGPPAMSKKEDAAKPVQSQKPQQMKNDPLPAEAGDAGSMEKIRDILFGNQVRDFERRFSQMEEHLNRSATDLRDEVTKRLEALERFFRDELETLKSRIKKEAEKSSEAKRHLADDLKSAAEELTSAIQQVDEKLSERSAELREQIFQQSKDLMATLQAKHEQADRSLSQLSQRLEESKIDRTSMAEYLVDMATRLSNHQQAPDAGEAKA